MCLNKNRFKDINFGNYLLIPLTATLTEGEGQIYGELLQRHCDLVAPLVLILRAHMRKANIFSYTILFSSIALHHKKIEF